MSKFIDSIVDDRDFIVAAIGILICVAILFFVFSDGIRQDRENYRQKCQQVYSVATTHADTIKLLSSTRWGSCPYYVPEIAQ